MWQRKRTDTWHHSQQPIWLYATNVKKGMHNLFRGYQSCFEYKNHFIVIEVFEGKYRDVWVLTKKQDGHL